jgi:hypothetical protein
MSENDASRIVTDNFKVIIQIVASLTDDSGGGIYDWNMFIVQAISFVISDKDETSFLRVTPEGGRIPTWAAWQIAGQKALA